MKGYQVSENGFSISIDRRLYARQAVMKALYAFHDQYLISYETEEENLIVYFESISSFAAPIEETAAKIWKELDFQMIRYDAVQQTKETRQLLVARALYATCIEPERTIEPEQQPVLSWKEDQKNIFSTWKHQS